jgi:hypothetical protein
MRKRSGETPYYIFPVFMAYALSMWLIPGGCLLLFLIKLRGWSAGYLSSPPVLAFFIISAIPVTLIHIGCVLYWTARVKALIRAYCPVPNGPAAETYRMALTLAKNAGCHKEAEMLLNEITRLHAEFYYAWIDLAKLAGQQRRPEAAQTYSEKALEVCPTSPRAHYYLACALEDRGSLDQALASFRTALDLQTRGASERHAPGIWDGVEVDNCEKCIARVSNRLRTKAT